MWVWCAFYFCEQFANKMLVKHNWNNRAFVLKASAKEIMEEKSLLWIYQLYPLIQSFNCALLKLHSKKLDFISLYYIWSIIWELYWGQIEIETGFQLEVIINQKLNILNWKVPSGVMFRENKSVCWKMFSLY